MGDERVHATVTNAVLRAAANDDVVRFRASTDIIDRHRSIVKQDGISDKRFMESGAGPFLWGHDSAGSMLGGAPAMENSIGKVVKITKSRFRRPDGKMGRATDIDVEFSKANPQGKLAAGLVKEGVLGNVSIAFIPKKHEMREIDGEEIRVYNETELLEVSLVPVASNPEAAALIRSIASPDEVLDEVGDQGRGLWHWVDGRWQRRLDAANLDEVIRQAFEQVEDETEETDGGPPPDNNGADTGAPEVVSDAVTEWVRANR